MTPKNLIPILIIGVIVVSLVFVSYESSMGTGSVTTALPSNFTANGKTFAITLTAPTQTQREHGLMNAKVTNTTIMLFAWPTPGKYPFWMYQTNTSLDIIWVNATGSEGRVVYVVDGAPPCYSPITCAEYSPTSPSNYVLEAKAGFAQANGIVVGTVVQFG